MLLLVFWQANEFEKINFIVFGGILGFGLHHPENLVLYIFGGQITYLFLHSEKGMWKVAAKMAALWHSGLAHCILERSPVVFTWGWAVGATHNSGLEDVWLSRFPLLWWVTVRLWQLSFWMEMGNTAPEVCQLHYFNGSPLGLGSPILNPERAQLPSLRGGKV